MKYVCMLLTLFYINRITKILYIYYGGSSKFFYLFSFLIVRDGCLYISVVMCESLVLIGNDIEAPQQVFEFCYIASETRKCIFFAF